MHRRTLILILSAISIAVLIVLYIRSPFSPSYFRQPLDISLQLAANFGELREDHFHMGLDIRTMGREDLPVYAAADGYISHVTIGQYGLGHALFITHPNGRTTVYGHLNRFFPELSALVQQRQYAAECWEQELDLPPGRFPVQKGQLIAYSGNTGSSQAPHLHFEIRDTHTGRNINPLLAGFTIPDELPPVIKGLYWYDRRISTYSGRARKIALTSKEGVCRTNEPVIKVSSPLVSLGISATDKTSNSPHLSGIFHAELWLDGSLLHSFRLSDLSYTDTRYINACIDYTKWIRSGIYVQHLSVLPGNHLSIFTASGKDGLIRLKDTLVHLVRIRVSDANDNHSDLDLKIQLSVSESDLPDHPSLQLAGSALSTPEASLPRSARLLLPGQVNRVNGPSVRARFSAAAFYDQVPFVVSEEPNTGSNRASALVHLHDPTVPVHDRYSVQLRTSLSPGDPLRNRTVMQLVSGDSQSIVKGVWQGDWMSGSFNRLGDLQLLIDTLAPQVQASGWTNGQSFPANAAALSLVCKDEGGMIARFRAELDGHWILFEQKGIQFRYDFDGHCLAGPHRLLVSVTDVAGNETRKVFSFIKQ